MNQMTKIAMKDREFSLTEAEFKKLTGLIRELTGIVLGDHKMEMLYGRLARRLRHLNMNSFSEYCTLLDSSEADTESGFLVNAVTTNLTKFYRESHHFDSLGEHLELLQKNPERNKGNRSIRIWSAGCSSGEEPYSIASVVLNKVLSVNAWDVRILATDLDTNMLDKGRAGIYARSSAEEIPDRYQQKFKEITSTVKSDFHIKEQVKRLVHFKKLNLLHQWPMKLKYDVIFCRNVLIYFDADTKENLVQRYANMLHPNGILFLGHSESLVKKIPGLNLIDRTTYRKEG